MKISESLKRQLKSLVLTKIQEEEERSATISTAYKLSEQEISAFSQNFPFLRNKIIQNTVDKDILGGFIIQCGSTYIDASMHGMITRLMNKVHERH
ncbi:MAG TPA: F0F1 ATP synthase subunit delta [Patescibacteria group bacterium]|nr:F0F1 ATP synthase subunit delta [Patescibacteria group bacterium]